MVRPMPPRFQSPMLPLPSAVAATLGACAFFEERVIRNALSIHLPKAAPPWSAAITSYFKTDLYDRSNIAGADAFLFGNWYDANAMSTDVAGADATTWGTDVQNWLSAYR
jgi:hypothetical protein